MDLFALKVPPARLHPVFRMLLEDRLRPERAVLQNWAQGFVDRDGKFVQQFQLTFESGLWELYLHACLRQWQHQADFSYHSPDFVVVGPRAYSLEATIASPAAGGKPAYGYSAEDIPEDFSRFNVEATVRISNSFTSKVKRYRDYYAGLSHVGEKPFVIGIASFDRPLAHFSASRPIIAALYGLYHDEAATPPDAKSVTSYNVIAAAKNANTNIDVGFFCDESYADVSAVIFSSLATWGKIRAMADNPEAATIYTTLHPSEGTLRPEIKKARKRDYVEDLMDGLFVFHNPFAKRPLGMDVFDHPRVCQMIPGPDGEIVTRAPSDFLLVRMLHSLIERGDGDSSVKEAFMRRGDE